MTFVSEIWSDVSKCDRKAEFKYTQADAKQITWVFMANVSGSQSLTHAGKWQGACGAVDSNVNIITVSVEF